jgi:radical SAM superfamily enzyme YgiQ (UPF0313 family)
LRILLLRPNSPMGQVPVPLGLGYVAGALRRRRGDDVRICDARLERLGPAALSQRIRDFAPQVLGISSAHSDRKEALAAAAVARAAAPETFVVVGGPYPSAVREAVLANRDIDAAVVGEGEETIVELLDALEGGGRDFSGIPGVCFRDGDEPRFTGPRPLIEDIDDLDPAWDLIDPTRYFGRFVKSTMDRTRSDHRAASIFSSRGCPYSCIFCHNVFGRKYRARSAASVVDEIRMLRESYGVREVEFLDDCFNHRRQRALAIFERLADGPRGMHYSFPNGLRADAVDDGMLDLFAATGVKRIAYAVESASPRLQKLIGKNLDIERARRAIADTARRGIVTSGFFIMGLPTETSEELRRTVDFAVDSELHIAEFFYLNPFPGTEVARMSGREMGGVDFADYSTISINLSQVSDRELFAVNKRAYRRFYLDPVRIARILKVVPKNPQLLSNILLTARLFFRDSVVR